jgi:hypothetical protein
MKGHVVSANQVEKLANLVRPHLHPSEQVLEIVTPVVPVRGGGRPLLPAAAAGHNLAAGLGGIAGNRLAQIGAVTGAKGSIADTFPHHLPPVKALCATDKRLLFLLYSPARKTAQVVWEIPRELVQGVQRRPRLQLLARFRLHFTDGSSVAVMTPRRRNIESLAASLGRCGRSSRRTVSPADPPP